MAAALSPVPRALLQGDLATSLPLNLDRSSDSLLTSGMGKKGLLPDLETLEMLPPQRVPLGTCPRLNWPSGCEEAQAGKRAHVEGF